MKCNKFYIIAMAASGKSTFAVQNPIYNGYQIIDFATKLPSLTLWTRAVLYISRFVKPLKKLVSGRPDRIARRQANYFSHAFEYIVNKKEPIVIFGRRTPNEFEKLPVHDSVRFAMVLIPEEDHRRNCVSRKRDLRNPFPLFHHWTTDFDNISEIRKNLRGYAEQHDIPVYDSFAGAIDDMHRRFSSE